MNFFIHSNLKTLIPDNGLSTVRGDMDAELVQTPLSILSGGV